MRRLVFVVVLVLLLCGVAYAASSTLAINAGDEVTLQPTGCTPQLAGTLLTCPAPTTAAPPTTTTIPSGSCLNLFVPGYYSDPSSSQWNTLIASRPANVILDVTDAGAGSAKDPSFATLADRLRAANIEIYGYIDTRYAARAASQVQAEVRNWKTWYGVTDIFLDEVTATSSKLAYYQSLNIYIHGQNPGSIVTLNPGVYPIEAYMTAGDVVVTFEDAYSRYPGSTPAWTAGYPSWRFVHIVLAAPSSALSSIIATAKSKNVGNVYVTDVTGANPFGALPSYWSSEVAQTCP